MKYSILGFQQDKLIANKLTVEDAFVLRTIKDMYSTSSMDFKDFEGIKYMWINYTYLLAQMPIVGSKRNLMRKIEQYGKDLFILRVLEKSKNGKRGNYSYITPTKKLDELQDFDLMTESHKGYDKTVIRVMTESHNKDTSIIDTSIKDNKDIKESYIEAILEIRNKYQGTKCKKDADNKLPKLIKTYGKEQLIRGIERYIKFVEAERLNGFTTLKFKNESTYWNGGYMDYLDENFATAKPSTPKRYSDFGEAY